MKIIKTQVLGFELWSLWLIFSRKKGFNSFQGVRHYSGLVRRGGEGGKRGVLGLIDRKRRLERERER